MSHRRHAPVAPLFAAAGLAAIACGACGERAKPTAAQRPSPSSAAPVSSSANAPTPPVDAGPYEGPWAGVIVLNAPIWSEMAVPGDKKTERDSKVVRLGYMRLGEKTPVLAEPRKKANCPDGWYELLSGGFVCGKYVTLDLNHPRFKQGKPPDLEGPLPYAYGVNLSNGTPLYRQVPSREQRQRSEPWLFKPKRAKVAAEDNPYAPPGAGASSGGPDSGSGDSVAIGENAGDTPEVPWWERESPDGGPPAVTLEDLQENGGPIARRMVKGFFLSLDRQFGPGDAWWRTVGGMVAPAYRIMVSKPATEYHGVWLGRDEATFATKDVPARRVDKLPVGFVLSGWAHKWTLDPEHKHVSRAEGAINRFDTIGLTGEKAVVAGVQYWETDEGWWMRAVDGTRTEPGPSPDKLGEHEKWIDVNLKRQTLVAFEGAVPVFATVFSSGRNEHETTPGSFRIREKHIAATMDGDADIAADGPYSIEDVPYIQYFNGGYALHGAFWHAEFGHTKSHGCVNLAPWDAKALFGWTEPELPDGWHAAFSTKDKPGTRVVVHERAPGTCEGPNAEPPQCPALHAMSGAGPGVDH